MRQLYKDQKGSALVLAVVVIAVLAVIGLAGYRLVQSTNTGSTNGAAVPGTAKVPAQVKNSAELRQAGAAVDSTSVNSGVNPSSLDSDLNSLL